MNIRYLLALLITLMTISGCEWVTDKTGAKPQQITGNIMYEERVPMPPEAFIQVVLQDMTEPNDPSSIIAEQLIKPTHAVPVPYQLDFDGRQINDAHEYAIRAEIRTTNGELLWQAVDKHPVITQGNPASDVTVMLQGTDMVATKDAPEKVKAQTLYYECTKQGFLVKTDGEEAIVFLKTSSRNLKQVPSASGLKYEGNGISFWSKGTEATIIVGKTVYKGCQSNPKKAPWVDAKNRGVDFRGVGNEPGWHIEIDTKKAMSFVYDYGNKQASTPIPRAESSGNRTTYHARTEANDLKVMIDSYPCADTMSGEQFSSKVTIEFNGEQFAGCGKWL